MLAVPAQGLILPTLSAEWPGRPALAMACEGWAGRTEAVWPSGCGGVLGHAVLVSAPQ